MAFGGISTLYIREPAAAPALAWASGVRKLSDAAAAAGSWERTTVTNHGTGGAVTRTMKPHATSTTDDAQTNFGWGVDPADMNSVSGALRAIRAGTHTLNMDVLPSVVFLAPSELSLNWFVYRVAPSPGYARTLVASGTIGNLAQVPVQFAMSAAMTGVPEIVFQPGETLQYSFEPNAAGVILTGRTVAWQTANQNYSANIELPSELLILARGAGAASAAATAAGAGSSTAGVSGSSAGAATVAGLGSSIGAGVGAASGTASASGAGASIAGVVGASSGATSVDGRATGIAGGAGASAGVAVAAGAGASIVGAVGSAAGVAVVDGAGASMAGVVGHAAGSSIAAASGSAVAGTVGDALGAAWVNGSGSAVLGAVGTATVGEGGGSTTILRPVILMDD